MSMCQFISSDRHVLSLSAGDGLKLGCFSLFFCRRYSCLGEAAFIMRCEKCKGSPGWPTILADNSQSAEMRISPPRQFGFLYHLPAGFLLLFQFEFLYYLPAAFLFLVSLLAGFLRYCEFGCVNALPAGFLRFCEFGFLHARPTGFLLSCEFGFLYSLQSSWNSNRISLCTLQGSLERESNSGKKRPSALQWRNTPRCHSTKVQQYHSTTNDQHDSLEREGTSFWRKGPVHLCGSTQSVLHTTVHCTSNHQWSLERESTSLGRKGPVH